MALAAGFCAAILSGAFPANARAASADIRINVNQPAVTLSPLLYGLFFEDVNYGADGGLYAELVQNRSFEYHAYDYGKTAVSGKGPLFSWDKIEREGARVDIAVAGTQPLNGNNPHYLEVRITRPGEAGVSNGGFGGIPIDAGSGYDFSAFARTVGDWEGAAALTVSLELPGGESAGSVTLDGIGARWGKFSGVITASKSADDAKLVVTAPGRGTLALDMVSLFPRDTWAGRKNGLRKDLVQAMKELNPKFFRFPGGCIVHGQGLKNAYNWKDSVGPVEERKPDFNLWGYHQTRGLGYYEYFLLCEDLGMVALPVVPVGVSCGSRGMECVPMDRIQPHIQDVLDLIEFANGPADGKWGAVRAGMGHPAPFNMEYICLGNEESDTPEVRERLPLFFEAIRAKHPGIKIIGTSGLTSNIPLYNLMTELKAYSSDEHYYESPEWFISHRHRFDRFDRAKPKIFIGEYASWGNNSLYTAVAEAAYLTGVERNGDMVDMTCYAPLFARADVDGWRPDLIFFDNRRVLRTPNYYVQQLFAQNKGDVCLASTSEVKDAWRPGPVDGAVGIGSVNAAIEVAELAVNGRKLDPSGWKIVKGDFQMKNGSYVQSDISEGRAMSLGNEIFSGKSLTYTVRGRRTSGNGGFIVIRFGADKDGNGGWRWSIGRRVNTRHTLELLTAGGNSRMVVAQRNGSLTEGWHDIKVVMTPGRVECFLDGERIHAYKVPPVPPGIASAYDRAAGEVIVKLVNPSPAPVAARITLAGARHVAPRGRIISLAGDGDAVNIIGEPENIKPVTGEIAVAPEFTHRIPPMSVEFIRVKAEQEHVPE
ncbi:MAG: hypothetical protein LBC18_08680 [Opitutaceae bacterium]|jgi:alpha-L-arabinofuranosidase|nr:hypothetical protein [Opitutaceae bacterium]